MFLNNDNSIVTAAFLVAEKFPQSCKHVPIYWTFAKLSPRKKAIE